MASELLPAGLKEFDAFPKLPSAYRARSGGRGVLTLLVALAAGFLLLNDVAEFVWGWPRYDFSVDHSKHAHMRINVDLVVNMPCGYLSVDLRDAAGDRLYLTSAFRRDGVQFDIGRATLLQEHAEALSARQAIAQSKRSRGFFAFWRTKEEFAPKRSYEPGPDACRIYGILHVKKVTANLHITTIGHGYQANQHVDHTVMNLTHVIKEFSFGSFFPDIVQPLDNSFELTRDPFISYQYFMHVVPTKYIAPRSRPLETNQYSVTHYTRVLEHHRGTPGIFFKFDIDPLELTIEQRTLPFVSFVVRCIGIVGGVFTCMAYTLRVGAKAVEAVTGPDAPGEIAVGASSGVQKSKWRGGALHARSGSGRVVRQGNAWVVEGAESPYGGSLAGTPTSPYMHSPFSGGSASPGPGSAGFSAGSAGGFGPPPRSPASAGLGLPSAPGSPRLAPSAPPTPGATGYAYFPPTPAANAGGFPSAPLPGSPHPIAAGGFGQRVAPPPMRSLSGAGKKGKDE